MSKIASKPVEVPDNTKFLITKNEIVVEGPKGKLSFVKHDNVSVKEESGSLHIKANDSQYAALSGTTRALLFNMVHGVSKGWEKKLKLIGVGYRAKADTKRLVLTVGFSHPVNYPIPEEIKIPIAPARLKTPTNAPLFIFGASCPNNVVAAKKAHC